MSKTFECCCCGEVFPVTKRRFLGRDALCEECFWFVNRSKHWSLF